MHKKGAEGWFRLWKKRHFVLTLEKLSYFEEQGRLWKGEILLKSITKIDIPYGETANYFNIITPIRVFEIWCEDIEVSKKWQEILKNTVIQVKSPPITINLNQSKIPRKETRSVSLSPPPTVGIRRATATAVGKLLSFINSRKTSRPSRFSKSNTESRSNGIKEHKSTKNSQIHITTPQNP